MAKRVENILHKGHYEYEFDACGSGLRQMVLQSLENCLDGFFWINVAFSCPNGWYSHGCDALALTDLQDPLCGGGDASCGSRPHHLNDVLAFQVASSGDNHPIFFLGAQFGTFIYNRIPCCFQNCSRDTGV
uniref:Uncharacterized protein n=1 Tax=Anguilla anguilla TaxID=7936 RepID=A0A0E9W6A5_ANGAN